MNHNISKLKECLSKGLYLDNLHEMIIICNGAIKKAAEPLAIYVLLSIFDDIYNSWNDRPLLVEEAKPVSAHVLRHTFSVNCIKRGISTRALQSLLGHDRLTTTEIYLNLSPEDAIREFREKW